MKSEIRALIVPLAERLINRLTETLRQSDTQRLTLCAIELLVGRLLAEAALELVLGLIGVLTKRGYEGPRRACAECGGAAKFQGYLRRSLLSSYGSLNYERAYYYCARCQAGSTPLDARLEIGTRKVTPRLERVTAFLSAHLSFGVVEHALAECYGVTVSDEAIRQVAEAVGEEARQWEVAEQQRWEAQAGTAARGRRPPKTWVIECDGKQVGFQDGHWQEVKVGVIYEVGDRAVFYERGCQEKTSPLLAASVLFFNSQPMILPVSYATRFSG